MSPDTACATKDVPALCGLGLEAAVRMPVPIRRDPPGNKIRNPAVVRQLYDHGAAMVGLTVNACTIRPEAARIREPRYCQDWAIVA